MNLVRGRWGCVLSQARGGRSAGLCDPRYDEAGPGLRGAEGKVRVEEI